MERVKAEGDFKTLGNTYCDPVRNKVPGPFGPGAAATSVVMKIVAQAKAIGCKDRSSAAISPSATFLSTE
jgi:hypothetical protein